MIAALGLVLGIVAGLFLEPTVPTWLQPYLPIAVVAALDAVFGGLRALLDGIFDDRVFVVSFVANVLVAALIVYLGDQLGVGSQLSTGVVVVLGIRIFSNAAAIRRQLFQRDRVMAHEHRRQRPHRAARASPSAAHERRRSEHRSWPSDEHRHGAREPLRGRARLRSALKPRATRAQVVAAVLCAVLGFAVAVQVRANQDAGLTGLRQTDLVRHPRRRHRARAPGCRPRRATCEDTRDRVSGGSNGTLAALEEARERARVLGILAGTLPAVGPGIELTISDPEGKVGSDVLLDTLQELRDAGAEAVEVSSLSATRGAGRGQHLPRSTSRRVASSVDGTVLELAVPLQGHRRVAHPRGRPGHPRRRARRAPPEQGPGRRGPARRPCSSPPCGPLRRLVTLARPLRTATTDRPEPAD